MIKLALARARSSSKKSSRSATTSKEIRTKEVVVSDDTRGMKEESQECLDDYDGEYEDLPEDCTCEAELDEALARIWVLESRLRAAGLSVDA